MLRTDINRLNGTVLLERFRWNGPLPYSSSHAVTPDSLFGYRVNKALQIEPLGSVPKIPA